MRLPRWFQWLIDELAKPRIGPEAEERSFEKLKDGGMYKQFVLDFVNDNIRELAAEDTVEVVWPAEWDKDERFRAWTYFVWEYGFTFHKEEEGDPTWAGSLSLNVNYRSYIMSYKCNNDALRLTVVKMRDTMIIEAHAQADAFVADHVDELKEHQSVRMDNANPQTKLDEFYLQHFVNRIYDLGLYVADGEYVVTIKLPDIPEWQRVALQHKKRRGS
jgi:hypothetical protein